MAQWFLVVAYDVVRDRRRTRLHRRLEALLPRVQKSVFEGPLPDSALVGLEEAIGGSIDARADTVRVYHLCAACRARTDLYGVAARVREEPEDVVVE